MLEETLELATSPQELPIIPNKEVGFYQGIVTFSERGI